MIAIVFLITLIRFLCMTMFILGVIGLLSAGFLQRPDMIVDGYFLVFCSWVLPKLLDRVLEI